MKLDLWVGTILVAGFVLLALSAPLVGPYDPGELFLDERLAGPSWAHPLGQDELGRDILSRLLCGARISLTVGILAVLIFLTVMGLNLLGDALGDRLARFDL